MNLRTREGEDEEEKAEDGKEKGGDEGGGYEVERHGGSQDKGLRMEEDG